MFFDTHAHLNIDEFAADRDAALARAREAGVTEIVNVGIDPATSETARELARRERGLHAAAAVHPNDVAALGEAGLARIEAMVREGGFVAVGETGLDLYRNRTPLPAQIDAFRRHLALAGETGLATVIHCRDAYAECLAVLTEEARRREIAGRFVMHCFSGDARWAREFVALGGYVSFSGTVTYPNAGSVREAAAAVPLDRTLVETDCPFLAPQPRRGKRNEPAFVVFVAEEIARIHGVDLRGAAERTAANARAVFRIGETA